MTYRTRRIILYGMILFFTIATPVILMYAWGYSFDFQQKKFVLVGGFYADALPESAQVYIDGKLKGETPLFLRRMLPGTYQIRLEKNGYQPWEKKLKVESLLVTETKNILLIPSNPIIEVLEKDISKNFTFEEYFQQKEKSISYYVNYLNYIVYKRNQQTLKEEQVSPTSLPDKHKYTFVSHDEHLAVLDEEGNLYLLDNRLKIFDKIGTNVETVNFSSDGKKLLYQTPSELWVYYLPYSQKARRDKRELITRFSQEIIDATWYQQNHIVFATAQGLKIIEMDKRDHRNAYDILKSKNIQQVGYDSEKQLIYLIQNNQLISINIEF